MGQPNPSTRHRPSPLPRDRAHRLLRAVEELRALDRERQGRPSRPSPSPGASDEIARRLEAKAREIFRLADVEDDATDRTAPDRTH